MNQTFDLKTTPDEDRQKARALVDQLHAIADAFEKAAINNARRLMEIKTVGDDAAVKAQWWKAQRNYDQAKHISRIAAEAGALLDDYQAGLTLASPNPRTGYALWPMDAHIDLPAQGAVA